MCRYCDHNIDVWSDSLHLPYSTYEYSKVLLFYLFFVLSENPLSLSIHLPDLYENFYMYINIFSSCKSIRSLLRTYISIFRSFSFIAKVIYSGQIEITK
jgi:hypothetical protein